MEPLARRPLPRTPCRVAPLGLSGSFGIDPGSVERAFHELGVNYLFVTPRTPGMIEGIRNLVRAGHRDEIVIAAGAHIPFGWGIAREWGRLARVLGVERIDVFHLFWVQARWYVSGRAWDEMRRLKVEGKAGALAISSHDRVMARSLADELALDVLMVRYNAAHRGAETEVFATLGDDRPGVVSYTATRWGKLLRPAGGLGPMTAPECYRFALSHPKVDVVLCGAKTWGEISLDAAGVAAGSIDPARLEEIRRFGDAVHATARGRIGFGGL